MGWVSPSMRRGGENQGHSGPSMGWVGENKGQSWE